MSNHPAKLVCGKTKSPAKLISGWDESHFVSEFFLEKII